MMLTTGGMNQPPFADCGLHAVVHEQQRREDHAHGEREHDPDSCPDRHQYHGCVGWQYRRADGADPDREDENPGGERPVQGDGHGVCEIGSGCVGMTEPTGDVRDPEPHREQRRQSDHNDRAYFLRRTKR